MPLSAFMEAFPALDLPISDEKVETRAMRTDQGLAVFFKVKEDIGIPPHSHGAQWGTVIEGTLELTVNGETRVYGPGGTYDIPAGVEHAAKLAAGSLIFDVFAEPDRYPIKG